MKHFCYQGQHGVLVNPISAELALLPHPYLQLTRTYCTLHIDARFTEAHQMFVPQPGVHDVESFLSPVKAFFDERAKHPVLLVDAVEERADVTFAAERPPGKLDGMLVSHVFTSGFVSDDRSPSGNATRFELSIPAEGGREREAEDCAVGQVRRRPEPA